MTKKDYIKLANVLKSAAVHRPYASPTALWCIIANDIADVCADDNPRFDRARFLTACGEVHDVSE